MKKNAKLLALFLVLAVMLAFGGYSALAIEAEEESVYLGQIVYYWDLGSWAWGGGNWQELEPEYKQWVNEPSSKYFIESIEETGLWDFDWGQYIYFEYYDVYGHICNFNGYRGFEAYHYPGLGHREFNYCSLNCGATQVIPNAYVDWVSCQECYPTTGYLIFNGTISGYYYDENSLMFDYYYNQLYNLLFSFDLPPGCDISDFDYYYVNDWLYSEMDGDLFIYYVEFIGYY